MGVGFWQHLKREFTFELIKRSFAVTDIYLWMKWGRGMHWVVSGCSFLCAENRRLINRLACQQLNSKQSSELTEKFASSGLFPHSSLGLSRLFSTYEKSLISVRELKEVRGADAGHLALNLSKYFECLTWALLHCRMSGICRFWRTILFHYADNWAGQDVNTGRNIQHRQHVLQLQLF